MKNIYVITAAVAVLSVEDFPFIDVIFISLPVQHPIFISQFFRRYDILDGIPMLHYLSIFYAEKISKGYMPSLSAAAIVIRFFKGRKRKSIRLFRTHKMIAKPIVGCRKRYTVAAVAYLYWFLLGITLE